MRRGALAICSPQVRLQMHQAGFNCELHCQLRELVRVELANVEVLEGGEGADGMADYWADACKLQALELCQLCEGSDEVIAALFDVRAVDGQPGCVLRLLLGWTAQAQG